MLNDPRINQVGGAFFSLQMTSAISSCSMKLRATAIVNAQLPVISIHKNTRNPGQVPQHQSTGKLLTVSSSEQTATYSLSVF